MTCGVGCRCSSDPVLLWCWCRPAATALTPPLAWEPLYTMGAAQEMAKRQKKKKKKFWTLIISKLMAKLVMYKQNKVERNQVMNCTELIKYIINLRFYFLQFSH